MYILYSISDIKIAFPIAPSSFLMPRKDLSLPFFFSLLYIFYFRGMFIYQYTDKHAHTPLGFLGLPTIKQVSKQLSSHQAIKPSSHQATKLKRQQGRQLGKQQGVTCHAQALDRPFYKSTPPLLPPSYSQSHENSSQKLIQPTILVCIDPHCFSM